MAKGDRYPGPHFWEGWAGEMMEDDFRCIFDPLGRYRPYIYMYICERAKAPITLAAPTENLPSPARNGNLRLKAKNEVHLEKGNQMVPATPKPEAPLRRTTFMAAKLDPTSPLPLPASLLPEPSGAQTDGGC